MGRGDAEESREVGGPDLLGICRLLNCHGVRYLIYGGVFFVTLGMVALLVFLFLVSAGGAQ